MTARRKHTPAPPQTPTQIRNYWRSQILSTAARDASLLEWLEPREIDLRKLTPAMYEPTIRKCSQLLDHCCQAERNGEGRLRIEARMVSELWNFMRLLAPSKRYPVANTVADLFQPHEDTQWPKPNS